MSHELSHTLGRLTAPRQENPRMSLLLMILYLSYTKSVPHKRPAGPKINATKMLESETKEKGKKGLLIPEMVEDLYWLFLIIQHV
jgi:hypothetical protein